MAPCDPLVDGDCRKHPSPRLKKMPLLGPDVRAAPVSLAWVTAAQKQNSITGVTEGDDGVLRAALVLIMRKQFFW